MKVRLVASTEFSDYDLPEFTLGGNVTDADALAEFAGRACYQSFHKPNPATRENADYLAHTNSQGHYSILEHASATFYVEEVSRNLTHELVRHRHLSYSELSQRYVDVTDSPRITPPAHKGVERHSHGRRTLDVLHGDIGAVTTAAYEKAVRLYQAEGLTRKEAREAARFLLSNNVETKIVVTGNMRAWRDFLGKRYSVHADAEIRALATLILAELRTVAPNTFADFPAEPFG